MSGRPPAARARAVARPRRVAVAVGLGLGALLAGLVGCGVSPQDEAVRIAPESVPFGLLEETPSTTVVDEGRTASVYLLARDRLVQVERSVADDGSLADLLELVVAGPTEVERSLGITSAVPAGTVASVEVEGGIATVDLTSAFGEIRTADQLLALGQIVYTLTDQPGIGAVAFTVEGEPITAPLSETAAEDEPLSRDDLAAIAPA